MGKITDEEFKKIEDLRKETNQAVYALGEIEYQRTSLDIVASEIKAKVKEIKTRESLLLNDLKEKYGNVSINIETGEF